MIKQLLKCIIVFTMTKAITADDFDAEVLNNDGVVLIDFWAAWCAPCLALAPIIEKVAENVKGKAQVLKLNVDENQDIAMKFGIRGIPTVKIFKGGKEVETIVGLQPQPVYEQLIEKHTA